MCLLNRRALQATQKLRVVKTTTRGFPSWHRLLVGWSVVFGLAVPGVCGATSPEVKEILPTGGQRGTELDLSFIGDRLGDTEEILAYEPGLEVLGLKSITNKLVVARVNLAENCSLGEHHLRARTSSGLSELRTFFVGPYRCVEEVEPNNDITNAQWIPLNTTVSGVIKSEDVDCFAVDLKRGQRLSAEVEGIRLGRALFDSRLTITTTNGTVLADVDDTWLAMQDPFASLVVPEDGRYIIRLRDATYGGNDQCRYRLHVGSFPRPTCVFPPGAHTGETLDATFFSEATGEFRQRITLPGSVHDSMPLFAELDGLQAPTPNWIRVSDFYNVLAGAGNQDRGSATVATSAPPFALNGILRTNGQEDWFQFTAVKDAKLDLSVYARRLRSPVDSVLELFDMAGHQLASNDDGAGADSELKFTPTASTNYLVRIYDKLRRGGPDFSYRVEIKPITPELSVKIPEVARNDTQSRQFVAVPRGNRFATLISAKRANFAGELEFEAALPQGVALRADTMAKNIDQMPLVFEATADAPLGVALIDLTATVTNGSGRVSGSFRQNIEWVQGPPNNASYYSSSVDKLAVAVTRAAPFRIRIVEPRVPIVQSGAMKLEVAADRDPGFEEPIELQMIWNPPGVSSQAEATIPKGATNVFYQLNAAGGAETRTWKIAVLGHATVDGGQLYVSSQLASIEVAPPFLAGKIETLWLNPGNAGKLTVNLQQNKPFEGKATIRLCGLPEKVCAQEQELTKDDKEVVFDLQADSGCPPGSFKNLFCRVELKDQGEVVQQNIASGGILRIVPPKKSSEKLAAAEKK